MDREDREDLDLGYIQPVGSLGFLNHQDYYNSISSYYVYIYIMYMYIYIYMYITHPEKKTNIRNPEMFNGWKMHLCKCSWKNWVITRLL